jgi:GNAT superfamily N-acetyltransferase
VDAKENETFALAAYARLFAPGIKYAESSIGRVITAPEARRTGIGKALMRAAIERVERLRPNLRFALARRFTSKDFTATSAFVVPLSLTWKTASCTLRWCAPSHLQASLPSQLTDESLSINTRTH